MILFPARASILQSPYFLIAHWYNRKNQSNPSCRPLPFVCHRPTPGTKRRVVHVQIHFLSSTAQLNKQSPQASLLIVHRSHSLVLRRTGGNRFQASLV